MGRGNGELLRVTRIQNSKFAQPQDSDTGHSSSKPRSASTLLGFFPGLAVIPESTKGCSPCLEREDETDDDYVTMVTGEESRVKERRQIMQEKLRTLQDCLLAQKNRLHFLKGGLDLQVQGEEDAHHAQPATKQMPWHS